MVRSRITTRRIRRLRSPPRTISIGGDIGGDTPNETVTIIGDIPIEILAPTHIPRPVIINSVKMRPEGRTELAPSIRTTVLTLLENDTAPRVKPLRRYDTKSVTDERLYIANSKGGLKQPTIDQNPVSISDPAKLRVMTEKMASKEGLIISPGQNIILDLDRQKGVETATSISIDGDQAVRVSFITAGGKLSNDIELPPHSLPVELPISEDVYFLAITGLGGHPDVLKQINPGSGTVTLTCSTDNTAAAGFHPRNRLVRCSNGYLCRGGVINSNGEYDDSSPWITASKLFTGATRATFQTSSSIDTVIIIYQDGETPKITSEGVDVVGSSHIIKGNNLLASAWPVKATGDSVQCTIMVETETPSSIHSVMAMKGSMTSWISTLQQCDWSTVVEEGAISNHGQSIISINGTPLIPKEDIIVKTKIDSKVKRAPSPSAYDLGEIEIGENYSRDISKLAVDLDEKDILTFEKVSGPEYFTVTKNGVIAGTPPENSQGGFKLLIRTTDLAGEFADAVFSGYVIEGSSNTAPFWKDDSGKGGKKK